MSHLVKKNLMENYSSCFQKTGVEDPVIKARKLIGRKAKSRKKIISKVFAVFSITPRICFEVISLLFLFSFFNDLLHVIAWVFYFHKIRMIKVHPPVYIVMTSIEFATSTKEKSLLVLDSYVYQLNKSTIKVKYEVQSCSATVFNRDFGYTIWKNVYKGST